MYNFSCWPESEFWEDFSQKKYFQIKALCFENWNSKEPTKIGVGFIKKLHILKKWLKFFMKLVELFKIVQNFLKRIDFEVILSIHLTIIESCQIHNPSTLSIFKMKLFSFIICRFVTKNLLKNAFSPTSLTTSPHLMQVDAIIKHREWLIMLYWS